MDINTYHYKCESNRVNKYGYLTEIKKFVGVTLKSDTSIVNPTFQITLKSDITADDISRINYVHWNMMDRYYFVKDIRILSGRMVELDCTCDVIYSFKDDILASSQEVTRQELKKDKMINDSQYIIYPQRDLVANPMTVTEGTGFTFKDSQGHPMSSVVLITSGEKDS